MSDPHRLLVVGPAWVGDMVMAQSLFSAIKGREPQPEIDVLAPAWSRPLLERMPEVNAAIELPVGHGRLALGRRWRLGRRLRQRRYAQAIVLPNSWKSALVPYWAGIPRRTGWVGELRYGLLNDIRRLDKDRLKMTVQRFVALAAADQPGLPRQIPPPRLRVDAAQVHQARQDLGLLSAADRRVLALCPGAEYGPAKRWPAPRFAELARKRYAAGWQPWLFGSENDRAVCAEVNRLSGEICVDLAGDTTLGQAVDLLSAADAVVTNDSGLMHVAAALERPLVALYGSSDPGFTPPLHPRHRIVWQGLDCSPCFERVCPYGHTRCLQEIPVDQVDELLDQLLEVPCES